MKSLNIPIVLIVSLISFFVFVNRKEFSRFYNNPAIQSNDNESAGNSTVADTAETKFLAETRSEVRSTPFAVPIVSAEEAKKLNAEAIIGLKKVEDIRKKERD